MYPVYDGYLWQRSMTNSQKLGIVFVFAIFRDSSMVEQRPVKALVVGSSPTRGANV